jgi:hypothetical protein
VIGDIRESCVGSILDWTKMGMHGAMHSASAGSEHRRRGHGRISSDFNDRLKQIRVTCERCSLAPSWERKTYRRWARYSGAFYAIALASFWIHDRNVTVAEATKMHERRR